jgi:hypothetical protein
MAHSIEEFLKLVREVQAFRKELIKVDNNLIDKVYGYFSYPESEQKNALIDWYGIEENRKKVEPLLSKWLVTNTPPTTLVVVKEAPACKGVSVDFTPPGGIGVSSYISTSCAGKYLNIDRTEAAYKELIDKSIAEKWAFRGLTVAPNIVDNKAVWTVFFY